MKELDKYFNIAFDYLGEPVVFLDDLNHLLFANAAFKQFLLNRSSELPRKNIKEIWPGVSEAVTEGEVETFFLLNQSQVPVKLFLIAIAPNCRMLRVLQGKGSALELQNSMHAQRVETLGVLAGGIAHDFNNILTGLLGHITYLKTILPESGSHTISLAALEEGARKASIMTQEILNFSRLESDEKPESVDLSDLILRTYNLLRGAISPEYDLECDIPEDDIKVLAVEAKVAQVLVNLVMNARDAIESGGYIKIKLSECNSRKELERVFATDDLTAKRYACLSVSDNGHGMTPEVLARIFEPYFSTKKSKGTGLGLAIVNEVVRHFAGAIDIKSSLGKGTTITIYLPIVEELDEKTGDLNARKMQNELAGGTEKILVVDDEYPVRNVLSLSLEHLGYKVEIAASGKEALEKYSNSSSQIDLVILDMLMPNLSGDQTFFRLKEMDPNVKVLVISGFASKEAVNSILDNGGLGFVQKPFTIAELAKRVRQCFEI